MIGKVDTSGTRKGLEQWLSESLTTAHRIVEMGMREAEKNAKATTAFKDRSGDTRSKAIKAETSPAYLRGKLRGLTKIVKFIEAGTKPHPIVARRARYLSFVMNGTRMFRRRVNHPGTKATHFMQHAVEDAAVGIRHNLQNLFDRNARAFRR